MSYFLFKDDFSQNDIKIIRPDEFQWSNKQVLKGKIV